MTKVKLTRPVNHEGKTYDAIEVDEPTVGAIEAYENAKAAGKSDTSAMIEMIAADSDWPAAAVRKIRASDLVKISEGLAPFLEDGPNGALGAPSSPMSPPS